MWWPFGNKQSKLSNDDMELPPPVTLTEDEREECDRFIKLHTEFPDGYITVPKELANSLQRLLIAQCLQGRAARFLILAGFIPYNMRGFDYRMYGGDPSRVGYEEHVTSAVNAAGKACAMCPLSIHFYDFACILRSVGKAEDARTMFEEFLRRYKTFPIASFEKPVFDQRDIEFAIRDSTSELSPGPEVTDDDIPF